jgi:hypothetical protein
MYVGVSNLIPKTVYRAGVHDKFRLWCDRKSHGSANFLKTVMNDASPDSTCDCVSRVKEWLSTVECFDRSGEEVDASFLPNQDLEQELDTFSEGCFYLSLSVFSR